jgi:hypothetical protein
MSAPTNTHPTQGVKNRWIVLSGPHQVVAQVFGFRWQHEAERIAGALLPEYSDLRGTPWATAPSYLRLAATQSIHITRPMCVRAGIDLAPPPVPPAQIREHAEKLQHHFARTMAAGGAS